MIDCRNIAKGKDSGELIVSSEPISFLGGVDPKTGIVIDPNYGFADLNHSEILLVVMTVRRV